MKSILVPPEIASDVEEIVNAMRDAAEAQGQPVGDSIRIAKPQTKNMVPGVTEAVIFVATAGGTWFTKHWFDDFVWPPLQQRISKPSEQAVNFVFRQIDSLRGNANPGS